MNKLPVVVLGATGSVGQRLISLLDTHPWFELVAVAASDRSVGRRYADALRGAFPGKLPSRIAEMVVRGPEPSPGVPLVLSALDPSVAGDLESAWESEGALVVTNAKNHRMREDVPLVIPEVNPGHLAVGGKGPGRIAANPNCATIGFALAIAPLHRRFGVRRAIVSTMQAASGAGYPGVPSLDLIDNVVPYIAGEEGKLAEEPRKIFGGLLGEPLRVVPSPMAVSASCHRVAVSDGHLAAISIELEACASPEEVIAAWEEFRPPEEVAALPSAPVRPLAWRREVDRPQPKLDRDSGGGMTVTVGRLRPCPALADTGAYSFEALSHNTIRGAAGGTLLLAELCAVRYGLLDR